MTSGTKPQAPCPTCRKPITWDESSPWRPFCSERCRLIDLGDWLNEAHRIPAESDDESQPFLPPEDPPHYSWGQSPRIPATPWAPCAHASATLSSPTPPRA